LLKNNNILKGKNESALKIKVNVASDVMTSTSLTKVTAKTLLELSGSSCDARSSPLEGSSYRLVLTDAD